MKIKRRVEWIRPEVQAEILGIRGALAFAAVVVEMAVKCATLTWKARKKCPGVIFLVAPRYRVKVIRRA